MNVCKMHKLFTCCKLFPDLMIGSFTACSSSPIASLVNTSENSLNPFYPFYPNNVQCTWRITAPKHQIIRYFITKYDLIQPGDYLEIMDGINRTSVVTRSFSAKPDDIERWASSGSDLWIKFKSDHDSVEKGFELEWTFVNKSKGML